MKRDKENIPCPGMGLKPVITAFYFLFRQLSRLMSFTHLSLVFPLHAASWVNSDKDAASRPAGKSLDGIFPAKPPGTCAGQEPGIYKPGALQINTQRFFHQDQKARGKISTPGRTWQMEPHMYSMRFLTTYARHTFPGFDSSPAKWDGVDADKKKQEYGLESTVRLSKVLGSVGRGWHPHPIRTKDVRYHPLTLTRTTNTNTKKASVPPEAKVMVDSGGIGLPLLRVVNRSLGFLNEVVQPTVVQVRLEEETKSISYPAGEKAHIDHVNQGDFLSDRVLRSTAEFTMIQDKAGNQNTFQTSVGQVIQYYPMSAKHFLETRRVDSAAGASGMFVRMRTYNIAPSLTSLAAAGNYLQTRFIPLTSLHSYSGSVLSGAGPRLFQRFLSLVSFQPSTAGKPTARRTIKSFDQTFSKVWPPAGPPEAIRHRYHHYHYANAGIMPQLRAAEELHRHVHEYGHELSTAVIVEKIYKTQFANGSKVSEANLNFKDSRDNQKQEVTNTFNVTMNLEKAFPGVWDGEGLQDLGERLAEILRDEARRYGIKV